MKKKKILLIVLIAVAILLAAAITLVLVFRDAIFTVESPETYTFINPDETKADTDPGMTVDGVFDESIYSQNTWTYLHNANGGNTVDIAMTSWFGEKGIYLAYEVRENTPIYVNMDRATWMNSCIEMYLVPSYVQKMPSEDVFEIDLLPNGYLLFKRPNAAGGWSDVSTTHDKMAYLGATTVGGEINTDDCTGYNLELFIPYDYLSYLGVDAQILKNGYVHINPSHITSYNETGTDGSVDRFWYSFGQQLGGDGWNDINRYFKFDQNGAMGTVKNITKPGANCTITANPTAIPGLETTVIVTPDAGYALTSICCNETEYISSVNYREDGSVKLTVRAGNGDLTFTAQAEPVTEGNKHLQGKVLLRNILADTYEGVTASYEDASGEHKLELSDDGSFDLGQLSQGMYTIRVKKNGYVRTERTICLNRDMDILVKLDYDLFETESGNCWKLEDANEGLLTKINGTGAILSKDALSDFYVEANFTYSQTLAKEAIGDDYQQQRMGLRVKFEDGKYWHIDLLKQNDGTYCLQYGKILGKNSLYNWDIVHTLTPEQIARYESDTGIKLGLLRLGKTAYLYLDNRLVATTQLPNEQAGAKAQVGFESFVSNAEIMQIPYRLSVKDLTQVELVDQGSEGATVSLKGQCTLGQDAVLQIVPTTTGKLLSLQVNGVEMAHLTKAQSVGYQLTIPNNREKILSVKVLYGTPELTTAVIDLQDSNASGISVRLMQDGAVRSTAVAADGKAVFKNVYTGVYQVQVQIFEVWTSLQWVTILDDETITVDVKTLFEIPENSNYTGNVKFSGVNSKNYSIATELTGEAWFTMQLQVDGAQLQKVAANRGNVRLGYRLFFGGDKGNYQWDNEYEITLKYTQEGTWVFEQMNTWVAYPVPQELVDALTHKGLYLALHRNDGILTLYCGATQEQLLSGTHAYRWDTATHKQKQPIMRFGVGFWSEKGSSYEATVTNLRYGTSLPGLIQFTEAPMALELLEHKAGAYHAFSAGTPVKLKSATQEYSFTTDDHGKILGKVLPGMYTVTVLGYADRVLEVTQSGVDGQLVLEYPVFEIPTGWDAEKHDLSKVNDLNPVIGMTGGTMNVLTKDTYQDVSASIFVKAENSLHSAHTQGIWVRFEDGKYMVLYQEDEKLLFADRLWDFETVTGQKQQVAILSAETMDRWNTGGYWLNLSRKGNVLYVTADGQQYQAIQLPAKYENHKVQVGYFAYDSAPGASWQFAISKELLPINEDVVISANVTVEDGTTIRLQKGGQFYTATFAQNQVTFQDLSDGKYQAQIQVFGYWADLGDVEITAGASIQLDVASLFEDAVDFDGNLHLSGTKNQHVSVAAEITGDAWFMMQLQVPKAQLDAVAANCGNVRLGYRLFFGGDKGNYQWDNEYEITLKYTQEGTWVFEQMNTWVGYPVPQELVDALTHKGLHLALHRNDGILTLYCGATQEQLLSGTHAYRWDTAPHKQQQPIMRFGIGFWSENGASYEATVTDLRYGTSLPGLVVPTDVSMALELYEHNAGVYYAMPATLVKLKSATQEYCFTTDDQGKIQGQVRPGSYTVTVEGYADQLLEVSESGVDGQLVLEYPFFEIPTGWDAEKHDLSKVNDLNPVIGMTGGTMNVLTKDIYQDVSVSIFVKAENSLHSAHTQGIWVRFEDGKYMVLYQEDEKLLFADRLWDFETVTGQHQQIATLSAETMDRWNTSGYWLTLSRKGNVLYATADGQQYPIIQLPAEYADHNVQVGYFAYDSALGASWQFAISKELPPIDEEQPPVNTDVVISANVTVEDGTTIRLQKDGQFYTATFTQNQVTFQDLSDGKYQAQIQVFGYWVDLGDMEITGGANIRLDVASLFEDAADFDGNLHLSGRQNQHVSVAAEITGDAWFMMQLQVPKAQLDAVAANCGNVRLGYRLFFGGETGNYLWDNEYEPTLKYTADGRWVMEQMNTWEGWDNYLSDAMVDALTCDGLYLALNRDSKSGVLTMYYGATMEELISGANSWKWTMAAEKQKETITRFGVGFWSENGSDYTANVTNLRYGTSLAEMVEAVNVQLTANADVPVRLTQNGQQKAVGAFCDGKVELLVSQMGNYRVEVQIFNTWCPVTTVAADGENTIDVDVLSVFENREFTNLDGNIALTGTQNQHCSVATEITDDAWFAMKVQVPKAQLDAVAANRGNVRLGYRLFFGGETGNYQWENEYEITLKYTSSGWIMEQMNTWEGWDRALPQAMVDALTGDGLYLALHRDSETGVLTMYYGATQAELEAGQHSYTYTQATQKHKETITRFGVGFWSENGSNYTAFITGLRYGATLDEALGK